MDKNYSRGFRKHRDFSGQNFYNDKKYRNNKFNHHPKKEHLNIREIQDELLNDNFSWNKNCLL